jgi:hypothetical protein
MGPEQFWHGLDLRTHMVWLLCRPAKAVAGDYEVSPGRAVIITCWPDLDEQVVCVPTDAIPDDDFRLDIPDDLLLVACDLVDARGESSIVIIPAILAGSRQVVHRTVAVSQHMVRSHKLRPAALHW